MLNHRRKPHHLKIQVIIDEFDLIQIILKANLTLNLFANYLDLENENEYNYDELNGYEYDDDFELNENPSTSKADESNNFELNYSQVNADFKDLSSLSKFETVKFKSIQHIKRLKQNIFNKNNIKSSLLSDGTQQTSKEYPYYSYSSTDSTIVQKQMSDEFELSRGDVRSKSLVTYDINKQKARQNLVRSNMDLLLNNATAAVEYSYEPNVSKVFNSKVLHLEANPLDHLDFEEKDRSNKLTHVDIINKQASNLNKNESIA